MDRIDTADLLSYTKLAMWLMSVRMSESPGVFVCTPAAYLCENRRAIVVVVSLSDRMPGSLLPPVVIVSTLLNKKQPNA